MYNPDKIIIMYVESIITQRNQRFTEEMFAIFQIIFGLLGGLALFIYALQSLGSGMQQTAGKKVHRVLEIFTSVPVVGMLFGTVVTMIVNSSTLVTVMVVSLVNTTMLNLKQAASVIMGANIGTTLTTQLVSFNITSFWVYFAFIGFVVYFVFSKKQNIKTVGMVIFSFGLLLLGLMLMTQAMAPLGTNVAFLSLIETLSYNRWIGMLAGAGFTAILQSSSAVTGIIVAMTMEDLIPLSAALPLILGANVGTCLTAVLASIGGTTAAKRAAMIHVIFNVLGALIFLVFLGQFETLVIAVSPYNNVTRQAANAHTLFSVISTIIFLPFISVLVKIVTLLIPERDSDTTPSKQALYLDWNMVSRPAVAIDLAQRELLRMGEIAGENIRLSIEAFLLKSKSKIKLMKKQEKRVNKLEKEIVHYLVRVAQEPMGVLSIRHAGLLHAANDIERVSDHARNIARLAKTQIDEALSFSPEVLQGIEAMYTMTNEAFNTAILSVRDHNPELVPVVKQLAADADTLGDVIRTANIAKMADGEYSSDNGIMIADIIANLERVGDHSTNISHLARDKI